MCTAALRRIGFFGVIDDVSVALVSCPQAASRGGRRELKRMELSSVSNSSVGTKLVGQAARVARIADTECIDMPNERVLNNLRTIKVPLQRGSIEKKYLMMIQNVTSKIKIPKSDIQNKNFNPKFKSKMQKQDQNASNLNKVEVH